MTVSGDPVDRFGLSAVVARCVSRLTEGAQSDLPPQKMFEFELIWGGSAGYVRGSLPWK